MRIILKKDVKGLGRVGDIVDASDGYARNYIIPKGLGEIATPAAVAQAQREVKLRQMREEKMKIESKKAAENLAGREFMFALPADDKGNLYAGLKEPEILAKIRKSARGDFPLLKLVDYHPIKAVGEHQVRAALSQDSQVTVRIRVNKN